MCEFCYNRNKTALGMGRQSKPSIIHKNFHDNVSN